MRAAWAAQQAEGFSAWMNHTLYPPQDLSTALDEEAEEDETKGGEGKPSGSKRSGDGSKSEKAVGAAATANPIANLDARALR